MEGSVVGVSGAMLVVGNVVDEPESFDAVVVLMTVDGDDVEEVVLDADVVVVVEGLVDTDGSLLLIVIGTLEVVARNVVEVVTGELVVLVLDDGFVVGTTVLGVVMVVLDPNRVLVVVPSHW